MWKRVYLIIAKLKLSACPYAAVMTVVYPLAVNLCLNRLLFLYGSSVPAEIISGVSSCAPYSDNKRRVSLFTQKRRSVQNRKTQRVNVQHIGELRTIVYRICYGASWIYLKDNCISYFMTYIAHLETRK